MLAQTRHNSIIMPLKQGSRKGVHLGSMHFTLLCICPYPLILNGGLAQAGTCSEPCINGSASTSSRLAELEESRVRALRPKRWRTRSVTSKVQVCLSISP